MFANSCPKKAALVFHAQMLKRNVSHALLYQPEYVHLQNESKFTKLAEPMRISIPDDWYTLRIGDKLSYKNENVLLGYENSLYVALNKIFPEYEWQPWMFKPIPNEFWENTTIHKQFFDWIATKLQITAFDGWYGLTSDQLDQIPGAQTLLITRYRSSIALALQDIYPDVAWETWKFDSKISANHILHKEYFDQLATQLKFADLHDWYRVTKGEIFTTGAFKVLEFYGGSLLRALEMLYPQQGWQPWRFGTVPQGYWTERRNQRIFFDWIGSRMGFQEEDDWYKLTKDVVARHGGAALLAKYLHNSPMSALHELYPEIDWQPWKSTKVPRGYWNASTHRKQFFDALAKHLEFNSHSDWYTLSRSDLIAYGGRMLLEYYENSICNAVQQLFPDYTFLPWKFVDLPENYWTIPSNQVQFLNFLASTMDVKHGEDWYKVRRNDIKAAGGNGLLKASFVKILQASQLAVNWKPWPSENRNYMIFFDWMADHMQFSSLNDWYLVSASQINEMGGATILKQCGDSTAVALASAYQNFVWQPWRFIDAPVNFWHNASNRRFFFDWLAEELDLKLVDDWYCVGMDGVRKHAGDPLAQYFHQSIVRALQSSYPHTEWVPWKFAELPSHFWEEMENQKKYLRWFEEEMRITSPTDWHQVTADIVVAKHGESLLYNHYHGSLTLLLTKHYPTHDWTREMKVTQSLAQKYLFSLLRELVPLEDIEQNARIPLLRSYDHTMGTMVVDLWFPSMNTVVEYQGIQHYMDQRLRHDEQGVEPQSEKDIRKARECEFADVKMIHIPYWWNYDVHSLAHTLQIHSVL